MENVECGAAALGIILSYFGRIVPLAELRVACGISRDGSKASNIVRAARHYGLNARGFKKEIDELGDVAYPFVVFWDFNHFLVVEGCRRGRVYLNDPATGPRTASIDEFDEGYTGVVLVMTPSGQFRKSGKKPSIVPAVWRRLSGSFSGIFACSIAALFMVIPTLAAAGLTQAFIDNAIVRGMHDWARPIVIGLAAAAVLKALVMHVELRILRQIRLKLATVMTSRFVWHLLRLPASYYAQRYSGEIASRIALNDAVADFLSGRLATTGTDLLISVVYALVMFHFDRPLTLLAIVFAAFNFASLRWISASRKDLNARLAHHAGRCYAVAVSGLKSIRTLKASALESDFFSRWAGHYAKTAGVRQEFAAASQYLSVLPRFFSFMMSAAIITFGGLRVMDGQLTIGMLVAFQTLATSFLAPVHNLMQLGEQLQDLHSDVTRLDDVLDNPTDTGLALNPAGHTELLRLQGHVELRNVTFGYNPAAPPLISDLSLSIKPGERVALVGSSGSGKSTIGKLICGVLQPSQGEILFDGRPRKTIARPVLTTSLAAVDQDIILFGASVRDNLTLWDSTIPQAQLIEACGDALIHDVVANLPQGYETQLTEQAGNLSGGQRQRLEIARALAADPAILVLDEATSALDAETERLIDGYLKRRRCSCVIVSHRLSTIRDADEILVLDGGKVVQRGKHADLIRAGGAYSRLLFSEDGLLEMEAAGGA